MFRYKLSLLLIMGMIALAFKVDAQSSNSALIKKYQSLVSKADTSDDGFISVHMNHNKLWLEIPDSIMGRDLLIGSRVEEISSTRNAVAGQMMHNPMMVRFSQDEKSVYLHAMDTKNQMDENDPISISFNRNSMQTIMHAFTIEARNQKNNASVIEVTKLFNSQIPQISPFGGAGRGKSIPEATRTIEARAYDGNVEIVTQMGFTGKRQQFMCSLHRSIVLLPKIPMQPRLASEKIGYYDEPKKELSSEYMDVKSYAYVKRWRIEAKKEDIERHKNGELVEPAKPIVFYVDNSIPEKWKTYIKAGIEDWQKAFEAIGFKNAIVAKDYPVNDTSFHANDFTNSCFRYVTTEKANAMGLHWIDPRSGEILQGDVLFYHNVIKKLYQWRFAQTAAVDPAIRGNAADVDDQIMGELIRYASAHEIGHALGLKHNYRASYAYPVDSLRSPTFTKKYGTAASIMDYARNNYIAQPGDKVTSLTPPLLGTYDYFSIKWAYQPIYSAANPQEELAVLNQWIADRSKDDMYLFGTKNGKGDGTLDPSVQSESLGDDVVKASRYGAANAKIIMENLVEWTGKNQNGSLNLKGMYEAVLKQYNQYFKHTEACLGGMYEFDVISKNHPEKFQRVSRKKQKEALGFIMEELLSQYDWLSTEKLTQRMGSLAQTTMKSQGEKVSNLVSRSVLVRMYTCSTMTKDPYRVNEYLGDISNYLFNVSNKKQSTAWMRNMQVEYVKGLKKLLNENSADGGHIFNNLTMADIKAELDHLHSIASKKAEKGNASLKAHFNYIKYTIER
ncbi:zinc-dependent metalloprotease [Marinifilum sp. D737]|uniref:zinc-dependent metalloprotease n=1 Tax=Marinifilum sp. D737 TaxID=2969628 RepID=UPI0022742904|nr:zinc-dependent metalloprotease [Marinifilum sp. D737]MCY1636446.1 zinc-dependent metalloprotease [Marinifilum sp. D737]